MGIFSRIKSGISGKANAALDRAIDPEKQLEIAIAELEEGRKAAMQELLTYKASAKRFDNELEKMRSKAAEWEKRAMAAVKAGDDEAAKTALREKKQVELEATKVERHKLEAASYAVKLNNSRKEFDTKLQLLKLRKGTLATQIAAGKSAGGDAFGNDSSVWDRFAMAEDRIDQEAIESEVDAAMRGESAADLELESKLAAAERAVGPAGPQDALTALKAKMVAQRVAKSSAAGDEQDRTSDDRAKEDRK